MARLMDPHTRVSDIPLFQVFEEVQEYIRQSLCRQETKDFSTCGGAGESRMFFYKEDTDGKPAEHLIPQKLK